MRDLVVLGAGTAGTLIVNKLRRRLPRADWRITIVDAGDRHFYQPGFLFLPFRRYEPRQVSKPIRRLLPHGVDLVHGAIDRVDPAAKRVLLTGGRSLSYDYLVIATGVTPRPDQTPGMLDGGWWGKKIFDFYTYDGAVALARALDHFDSGRLVVHVTDVPIKCPVAPLEFTFLADDHFRRSGRRDRIELVYATPLPGAFTKPIAAARLGSLLDEKKITVEPDFLVERIDGTTLVSYDDRKIPFDLLVTVPLNMGADYVARSGLGDELNLVPVDRQTLQAKIDPDIFAVGDANDLPTSKAGSVAHFSGELFAENFVAHVAGRPMTALFDGHANCFVETGGGRALLLDFNYDTEPLTGSYPIPVAGPFRLLAPSAINHWGKLAFRHLYWHALLPGRPLPLPARMTMAGKHVPAREE
jgi:sulfide:quinone oxidoreductase